MKIHDYTKDEWIEHQLYGAIADGLNKVPYAVVPTKIRMRINNATLMNFLGGANHPYHVVEIFKRKGGE